MEFQADLESDAVRLVNALTGAVIRSLRRQDSIAVAVSGGLDSGVLAALAARHFDGTVQLVTASAPGSPAAVASRRLAGHLGLPLAEVVLTDQRIDALLPTVVEILGREPVDERLRVEWGLPPGSMAVSPVQTAWELPLLAAAQEASRHAKRLLLGQGADELLGGYARYVGGGEDWEARMESDLAELERKVIPKEAAFARHAGVSYQYPFLDPRVRALCRSFAPDRKVLGEERKRVLRRAARLLDLPEDVVGARKSAAQYGSGVSAYLAKRAQEAGLPQNEFLSRLAATEEPATRTASVRNA